MTREEFVNRVYTLISDSQAHMKKNLEKVIDSGCLDIESSCDWRLAKNVLVALLKEEEFQYGPFKQSKTYRTDTKEINNIYAMI